MDVFQSKFFITNFLMNLGLVKRNKSYREINQSVRNLRFKLGEPQQKLQQAPPKRGALRQTEGVTYKGVTRKQATTHKCLGANN